MIVVGLTGGIGAGKSTVAAMLAERGAVIVDTDLVAREVVVPGGPAHDALLARFGTLDRAELADIVFSDPGALADLNAIVHPAVHDAVAARLAAAAAAGVPIVVLVVPLLVESANPYPTAGVLVVDCPEDVAVRRVVEGRGMAEADVRRRLAAQATRAQRLAVADFVVVNDCSPADLGPQVDAAWSW
ncbi:MAG: dephospho-CoA kinase, partial [Acidimicrobiales bacterium]